MTDWQAEAERWRRSVWLDPLSALLRNNLANALWLHDAPMAALPEAERAVRLDPGLAVAWRSLGNILQDIGLLEQAVAAYQRCMELQADPAAAISISRALIGLGRYGDAYRLADQRLALKEFAAARPGPYWQGWPEVKALWLWSEQGHGDGLQHLRWLVPLLQQGRRVVLELQGPLVPLAREGLAWVGGDLEVRSLNSPLPPLPPGACQGPLLSLPSLLAEEAPAPFAAPTPYLRLTPAAAPRTAALPRRVGLVWASGAFLDGRVLERNYRRKSLLGPHLVALLNGLVQRPLELVSLQSGVDRQPPPWNGSFAAVLCEQADFLGTARLLQGLDLLISVDTAAAHLAGAMGVPVWLLLPWAAEGRWGRGRSDSPWYPTMRLLRQPRHQDWEGLIRLVLARLDLWLTYPLPGLRRGRADGRVGRSEPGLG